MSAVPVFAAGHYRFIKAVFQYSGGVAAEPGYEIERARFHQPLPLADAFAAVEAHLKTIGRPVTAFAACELRTPAPFTEQGFIDFNKAYVTTLERWGIYTGGEHPVNPVARTNVCPMYGAPRAAVMTAFSYTVPTASTRGTFILAGGGEARDGPGSFRERIVRLRDTSPEGLHEKVQFVAAEMADTGQPIGMMRHAFIPRGAANFKVFADMVKSVPTESFREGSEDEVALRDSRRAFDDIIIRPHFLDHDVSKIDTSINLFGKKLDQPTYMTVTGGKNCLIANGEEEAALGAGASNSLMITNGGIANTLAKGKGPKVWWQYTTAAVKPKTHVNRFFSSYV